MDKYAVVLDPESTKVASGTGQTCPQCDSPRVNYRGLTPHCSQCGTEPWERRHDSKNNDRSRR